MDENLKKDHTENLDDQVEMINNDYGENGEMHDSAVVIEEEDRTVLLTEDETIVIDKPQEIDIVPKNRPRKVYAGMWGKTEAATVALAMLAILTSVLFFVFLVLPEQKKLEENRAKRDQLERELTTANSKYGDITSTETQVAKLTDSVSDFETRFLRPISIGRLEVYQKLNGLIAAYNLVNTSGPSYEPLEVIDAQALTQKSDDSGRGKFQSLFAGDYVTVTVEGSYQNLRRFIREIETNDQFMMVTAVEFEPAETNKNDSQTAQNQSPPTVNNVKVNQNFPGSSVVNPNQPPVTVQTTTAKPQAPRGRTIGEKVSLRIEMAAYYRRPNFVSNDTTVEVTP